MDVLPWHLQLRIYRGIRMDTLRALGVSPSRLVVPASLKESLAKSMRQRQSGPLIGGSSTSSWTSMVSILIAGTAKTYELRRLVMLHEELNDEGKLAGFRYHDKIVMHRSDEPLDGYSWARQVRLKDPRRST